MSFDERAGRIASILNDNVVECIKLLKLHRTSIDIAGQHLYDKIINHER